MPLVTHIVTIDHNPYDLEIDGGVAVLKDAPIDITIPDRWTNRFSEEQGRRFSGLYFCGEFFLLEQVDADWRFERKKGHISEHHVLSLIRVHLDAFIDLAWEALKP